MRFRTKPVEIEAVQWTGDNLEEIQKFVGSRTVQGGWEIINFQPAGTYALWIHDNGSKIEEITAEIYDFLHKTWVGVKTGQWIIKGTKGEFYPCDPDVFKEKYELVHALLGDYIE